MKLKQFIIPILAGLLIAGSVSAISLLAPWQGGTGLGSYSAGDIIIATSTNTLYALPKGSDGQVLKLSSGIPAWGTDATGGAGGSGVWATTTNGIYPTSDAYDVMIGNVASSTAEFWFDVSSGDLTITGNYDGIWQGTAIENTYIASSTEFLVDNDTTYVSSDFTHDDLTGFVANEHLDWTGDLGAVNIHAGNYNDTTIDGCTNCLNATEIEDIYILKAGYSTGNLTSDLNIDSNTLVVDYDTNEVGIGIADPLARLHINYPASGDIIFQAGTGDGGADMDLKYGYNGYGWYNTYLGSGSGDGNQWQLWSEGAGTTDMQVYGIMQSGNIQFMKMLSLNAGTSVNDIDTTVADSDNALITSGGVFDGLAGKQALDATLTDIADGTIAENLVNTAHPWADNEVSNTLTVTGYMQDEDINTFSELQSWVSDETIAKLATTTDTKVCIWNATAGAIQCESDAGGDITDVFNCSTGDCSTIVMGAADSLDCSSGDITLNTLSVDAGTYVAASIDGDDVNSNIAGRSLTLTAASPDTLDIDAEIYTDVKCIYFEDPTATDDFKSIWTANGFGATITKMWCESDQTVNMDLQVDDGTPADVNGTDLVCDSTPAEDESMGGDATLADGNRLDLAITSVSGTPTWVSICWTYTKDD